jgi:hypothetical protein
MYLTKMHKKNCKCKDDIYPRLCLKYFLKKVSQIISNKIKFIKNKNFPIFCSVTLKNMDIFSFVAFCYPSFYILCSNFYIEYSNKNFMAIFIQIYIKLGTANCE